jgi:hypothetical protein
MQQVFGLELVAADRVEAFKVTGAMVGPQKRALSWPARDDGDRRGPPVRASIMGRDWRIMRRYGRLTAGVQLLGGPTASGARCPLHRLWARPITRA